MSRDFFKKEGNKVEELENQILEVEQENEDLKNQLKKYSNYEDIKLRLSKANESVELANTILKDERDKVLALKGEIADKNNEIKSLDKVISEQGNKINELEYKLNKKGTVGNVTNISKDGYVAFCDSKRPW